MEQNQFSLDFDSENFMNDEERWINWLVFGLRDCTNVLNDVRECVPVNQIMTLLKVMDRWNLWKQGDEYLIACKRYISLHVKYSYRESCPKNGCSCIIELMLWIASSV